MNIIVQLRLPGCSCFVEVVSLSDVGTFRTDELYVSWGLRWRRAAVSYIEGVWDNLHDVDITAVVSMRIFGIGIR